MNTGIGGNSGTCLNLLAVISLAECQTRILFAAALVCRDVNQSSTGNLRFGKFDRGGRLVGNFIVYIL